MDEAVRTQAVEDTYVCLAVGVTGKAPSQCTRKAGDRASFGPAECVLLASSIWRWRPSNHRSKSGNFQSQASASPGMQAVVLMALVLALAWMPPEVVWSVACCCCEKNAGTRRRREKGRNRRRSNMLPCDAHVLLHIKCPRYTEPSTSHKHRTLA